MTNKINTVLKAITDRITGALPSDTVKNLKLNVNSTSLVLSARSYPTEDPQCSTRIYSSINAVTICPKHPDKSQNNNPEEEEREETDKPKNNNTNPSSPRDPSVSFITEKVLQLNSFFESLSLVPSHLTPNLFARKRMTMIITYNIEHVHVEKAYIDLNSPLGVTQTLYNWNTVQLDHRGDPNRRLSNFTGRIKGMHVFVGNFTYVIDFMIVEDISSIIDPRLSQVVLRKPFVEISNMTHDPPEGVKDSNLVSPNLRNRREQKERGVEYLMSKILGFYKECLELGPEYLTGIADEGEVT
ncbi:hypothetical protein Tco_0803301 [Tanacetum coccineum]|uniref:MAK10-like protein n=1 Tax=Tanacetum coccineum TaxID=301880 RepID=A0ABQ5A5K2_9ASTR